MGKSLNTRARSRGVRRVLIAAWTLVWSVGAHAQKLNLDPPKPAASEWSCIEALAAGFDVQRPLGALAARLLRAPSRDEADLAERVVLALTLDKAARDPALASLDAARREALDAAARAGDGASVAATRAALAPSLRAAVGSARVGAWFVAADAPPARVLLAPLLEREGAAPEELDAARALDALLTDQQLDRGAMLGGLNLAPVDAILELPAASLPPRTRERFVDALRAASLRAGAGEFEPIVMLAELAAAGPILRRVRDVSSARMARQYEALLREAPDLPAGATRRRLARARELASLAAMPPPSVDELALLRQLKPAHGQLLPTLRAAQRTLGPVVLRLLDPQESLLDPGILSAESTYLNALEDLRSLSRISRAVTAIDPHGKPVARAEARPALEKLLRATKSLARAKDKEAALAEFRALRIRVEQATVVPGEESLRRATETTTAQFLSKFDDVRARYLVALASKAREPDPAFAVALESAQRILALRQRATVADGAALGAWPALELSGAAASELRRGLDEQILVAMRAFNADRHDRAAEAVSGAQRRYGAALLLADLARALGATGAPSPSVLEELGAPEPDALRCPGAEYRGAFALLALRAQELAVRRAAGAETGDLEDRLNSGAAAVRLPAPR